MLRLGLSAALVLESFVVGFGVVSAAPASGEPKAKQDGSTTSAPLAIAEPAEAMVGSNECAAAQDEPSLGASCESWCGRYPSFEDMPRVVLGVDLLPEIGTSAGYEDNHVRHLSLNLIGGYSGGLEGVELSSAFSVATTRVYGVQLSGLLAFVGSDMYGLQLAGLLNAVSSSPHGVQIAGLVNTAGGVPRGLQWAGGLNFANDGVRGLQFAGAANLAGGLEGAQVSGALNVLDTKSPGTGAQVGAVNIATGGLEGLQLGAVNVAGPGRTDVQIGLINVAERSDYAFGLVNVLYDGRTHVDVWFAETGFAHVGLKHGGRWFHNIYGLGFRSRGPQASLAFGMGTHLPLPARVFVDVDLLGHALLPAGDDGDTIPLLATLRVLASGPLSQSVSLFAGPSYNLLRTAERDRGESYPLFGDHELPSSDAIVVRGWPGIVLGLEFLPDDSGP